jgi:hypothetical protein
MILFYQLLHVADIKSQGEELFNMKTNDALKLFNNVFDEPCTHLDVDTVYNIYYKKINELISHEE